MRSRFPSMAMGIRFIDIGANLTDPMFQGQYGHSQKHQPDLDIVLKRAWDNKLDKIIVTVGTLNEVESAFKLARFEDRIFYTIGCHPTRCNEFLSNPEEYYQELCKRIEEDPTKVVAIGECGLDYDRLQFCEKNIQKLYFEKQLTLAKKYKLPVFLHCRNAHEDFIEIIERNKDKIESCGGVVHSFDGTAAEAKKILDLGFFIGLNGCSLKTENNLEVVQEIPMDRIMIESDSPWCGIRPSHAGFKLIQTHFPTVKKKEKWSPDKLIDGRNEPCQIIQNMEIIACVKNEPLENLASVIYKNTIDVFFQ